MSVLEVMAMGAVGVLVVVILLVVSVRMALTSVGDELSELMDGDSLRRASRTTRSRG